ncbi:hypothetical protein A3F08_00120 [Candidatus Berkelbacteria bacterium RIFCSPHIGHO2_12_FULL_36_9]|uniref:DUF2330 domain-containing protein n=1 Tax=Candidatus Berkelbacteria bacterium RIFCSPHIGHO2_12_FULL_36_9 TaxID=1797469 RepID=A0A1F5EET3_9BACT|nr:MAG: hypothetical protein A3F08_00120 [Candidatus Berkelbacteria bacterium RIFCSPHIGHO2_12_FULL_36_9]
MIKKIVGLIVLMLFFVPLSVKADGAIMPSPGFWIYETGQKATIYHDGKTETLVLQTSFSGDAKNFAYIVPTPSKPEVSKVSDDIFTNLETLTMNYFGQPIPMVAEEPIYKALDAGSAVNVLEEKQVGLFEVKVLSATDASALFNWLKENDFTYPESKKYILDDYIQNKWFFTTAKISAEVLTEDVETKSRLGKLTPLKLVFQSKNIVYPLKISAVVEESIVKNGKTMPLDFGQSFTNYYRYYQVPITLYVFSDHKKEASGFDVQYANWVKPYEIEKLAKNDNGNAWVDAKKKMYLTKLYRTMLPQDMTNDVFPDNAENNSKVGVPTIWDKLGEFLNTSTAFVILTASLLLFSIMMIVQFRSERRKITYWIIQLISFVVLAAILGLSLILSFQSYWRYTGTFDGGLLIYQLTDQTNLKNIFLIVIPLCVLIYQRPRN